MKIDSKKVKLSLSCNNMKLFREQEKDKLVNL